MELFLLVDIFNRIRALEGGELSATTVTLASGADATVEMSGVFPNQVINLGIPRGSQGEPGPAGGVDSVAGLRGAVSTAGLKVALSLPSDTAAVLTALPGIYVPQTRTIAGHELTADVTLNKGDVGLGNVNDTSDEDKPVSIAQAEAIAAQHTADQSEFAAAPEDGYDVILLAGQSNMVGLGTPVDATLLDNSDPRIHQWAGSGQYLGSEVLATNPLLHHSTYAGVGPGLSFAKWYVRTYGRNVLLVPVAHSGTGFTTTSISPAPGGYHTVGGGGSWDKAATDGGTNLYAYAVAQANAAIASNPNNRLVAILWQHGSADGAFISGALTQAQFQTKMNALVDNLRADIAGASDVPILIGREPKDWYVLHAGDTWTDTVHLNMPAVKENVAWVEPAPIGGTLADQVHLTAAQQRIAGGSRYPTAYLLALANVIGPAPIAPAALSFVQSTTTVTVSWDRPLGRATDYLVEKNTGSGWTTVARTASTEPTQVVTGLTLGTTVQFRVSTINEQGTSAPTTASFDLVDVPSVPTGLAGTMAAWSAALTWNPVTDAASYLVEYKTHASGVWLSAGSVISPSKIVSALLPSTSYDFRVSAVNAAGSSAASSTLTQSTSAPTYLSADVGVDPVWAYSVRKVRSAYAGSCLRVRRSSDNAQQDIGFDVNGLLDVAALATFVGGANSGYVAKWYNQGTAGATADIAHATASAQPRIIALGVVDAKNGIPSLLFDGTNDFLYHQNSASTLLGSPVGASALIVASTRKTNSGLLAEADTVSTSLWSPFYLGPALNEYFMVRNDLGTYEVATATTATITDDDSLNQESAVDSLTQVQLWRNAASILGPVAYSRSGAAHTAIQFQIGVTIVPQYHQGYVSEVVLWTTALLSASRVAGELNQHGYFATP